MQNSLTQIRITRSASQLAHALGLLTLSVASGCSSDQVSIGAGEVAIEENSICESGLVRGNVTVSRQEQIDSLAGCEKIEGDFWIVGFPGIDLRPLASLREVRSNLIVGAYIGDAPDGSYQEPVPIPSLEGLEALERVSSLSLDGVSAPDLSSLANLTTVRRDPTTGWLDNGYVEIDDCDQLRDLSGLENLVAWDRIMLTHNDALESLDGLQNLYEVGSVTLSNLPRLKDVSALAPAVRIDMLVIDDTGLESMDLGFEEAGDVMIWGNPELRNLGLGFYSARSLSITNNPKLETLPQHPNGILNLRTLQIVNNPELRSVPPYLGWQWISEATVQDGFDLVEIGNNPALTELVVTTYPTFGGRLAIYGNTGLTHLELGKLEGIDLLSVRDNAALSELDVGTLATVDHLEVVNNPLLSTETFADVLTFSREMSGNMDE